MLRIAHRGASGYAPENTLAAFKKAIELKADMIELDVRVCKSGELVVIHDARVDRTTNGYGSIKQMTLTEIKQLVTEKGERIPTLHEVLHFIGTKAKLNIDIRVKNAVKPTVELLTDYVKRNKLRYEDIVISSPNVFYLRKVKNLNPYINVAVIMRFLPTIHTRLIRGMKPLAIQPHFRITNKKFVDKQHEKGLKIFAWTLNEEKNGKNNYIEKIKQCGVDGIISNYPDRI